MKPFSYTPNAFLNLFPNIQKLELNFENYVENYFYKDCNLYLPRLKKLNIRYKDNLNAMPNLVKGILINIETLVSLNIWSKITNQLVVNSILEQISQNRDLVELRFITGIGLNQPFLDLSIRQMPINCPKLKRFEFVVTVDNNASKNGELLSAFKQFKELEYLGLTIHNFRYCLSCEELI